METYVDKTNYKFENKQEIFVTYRLINNRTSEKSPIVTTVVEAYSKQEAHDIIVSKKDTSTWYDVEFIKIDFKLTEEELQFKRLIDELEDDGADTERMIEIARYLKNDNYIKIFEALDVLREIDNGYENDLSNYKYSKYCEMRKIYAEETVKLGL